MRTETFFRDKVVWISGASTGIGKEMAARILEWGGSVIITARDPSRLQAAEKQLNVPQERILLRSSDASSFSDNQAVMAEILAKFGRLDVVVCNAALSSFGELKDMSELVIHQLLDTNIKGPVFMAAAAARALSESKGSILFVSSLAAFWGLPNYALYSMSKRALSSLAQSLRLEWSGIPVRVGIAYVSFTENENSKRMFNTQGEEIEVPSRNKYFTHSRSETATRLLRQIAKGKKSEIQGLPGNILVILVKLVPGLLEFLATTHYKRSKALRAGTKV